MKIKSYSINMKREDAYKIAEDRGNILGKIFLKNKKISNMKTYYIENKIITFEMQYEKSFISKFLLKNNNTKNQKIKIIADGSTGGVSYFDSGPNIIDINTNDDNIQHSIFNDNLLIDSSKKLARKIVRRKVGGNVIFKVLKIESIFRPYYVAFYGELEAGNKVRYLPISADGCINKRSF